MSDVTRMWWSLGLTVAGLALVYAYTHWGMWRFRRKLAVREAEAERVHQEKMQRHDAAFRDWLDKFPSDPRSPVTPWVPPHG